MPKVVSQYKEAKLPPSFCAKQIKEISNLIESGVSFTVCGMPGVGVSIFLRFLASHDFAKFYMVDVYKLPSLTREELFKSLLLQLGGNPNGKDYQQVLNEVCEELRLASNKNKRVVIIFNRFDNMRNEFDRNFFSNLLALREIDRNKISCIFTANKPLISLSPEAITGGFLFMFSKSFYLKPFTLDDLHIIAKTLYPGLLGKDKNIRDSLKLSGGHHQLMQLIFKSVRIDNPIMDQFVRLQLKEIYECLNYKQKKDLQAIARGKVPSQIDEYLLDIGLVDKEYKMFSPLMEEYVRNNLPKKIPVKEAKLFNLLKSKIFQVIPKEEIYINVWGENNEDATEWALNALIYRLRKNPAMRGYVIESHKKLGYSLTKE